MKPVDEPTIITSLRHGGKDYVTPPAQTYTPVDNATGKIKYYNGLTAKQENFCRYIANGETQAGAYRKAYGTRKELRADTVYNRASVMFKRPDIQARINVLVTERETVAIADYAYIRRFILERLQLEAMNCKTDAVRIKALELLGKIDKIQLFSDGHKEEDGVKAASKDVTKELEARLTKLLGGSPLKLNND